jgi:hypothetical protein
MGVRTEFSMSPSERASLEAMFKAFAPEHCERWSYLLALKPARWGKITPMLAWPVSDQFESYPNEPLKEVLCSADFLRHATTPSVVLRCGHSPSPSVQTIALSEAFPNGEWDYDIVFEGFISVVPGKLALGFNHEGGFCVYGGAFQETPSK